MVRIFLISFNNMIVLLVLLSTHRLIHLPLLVIFILRYSKFWKPSKYFIFISFCAYALNLITSFKNGVSLFESLTFSLKIFTPIYFFCALIIYYNVTGENLKRMFLKTSYFCLFLVLIALLFFNPSYNRLESFLPIYFDSMHTHSYLLVSVFIGMSYLIYRSRFNDYYLIAFLGLSFVFLLLGYNIRTALIMYLMFILVMLFLVSDLFLVHLSTIQ